MTSALVAIVLSGSGGGMPPVSGDALWMEVAIRGIPRELVPSGLDSLGVIFEGGLEDDPLLTVAGHAAGTAFVAGSVPFPGTYNRAKADWWWDEDRGGVVACSQMPFSAFCFCASYSLTATAPWLELSESWTEDPSAADVDSAALLIEGGDFQAASGILSSIMYPGSYIQDGEWEARFLRRGHELGLEAFAAGSPGAGAAVIEDAVSAVEGFSMAPIPARGFSSREEFEDNPVSAFIGLDEYAGILNDYGFFLAECGRHSEALPVFDRVVILSPDRAVARLNLADTLWDSGETEAAGRQYAVYIRLLEEKGLMHNCPSRALERAVAP